MLYGNLAGFIFAVIAFCISVISFPMLLDRDIGAAPALLTSVRAVTANPLAMAAWGLIVAVLLVLGSLPAFIGLGGGDAGTRSRHLASLPETGRTLIVTIGLDFRRRATSADNLRKIGAASFIGPERDGCRLPT